MRPNLSFQKLYKIKLTKMKTFSEENRLRNFDTL